MTQETTLDFHGGKLIVPTADLITAWMQRGQPRAPFEPPNFCALLGNRSER